MVCKNFQISEKKKEMETYPLLFLTESEVSVVFFLFKNAMEL